MQPITFNERTGQIEIKFKGGAFVITDSSTPEIWDSFVNGINQSDMYTFQYQPSNEKIFGDGVYSLVMHMPGPVNSSISLPNGQKAPFSVALVVSSVIDGREVHEIYNYARHKMSSPGTGKALLDFLKLFTWWPEGPQCCIFNNRLMPKSLLKSNCERDPAKSSIWLGIRADEIPMTIMKLYNLYNSAGFYFPCILPNIQIKEHITPRGFTPGFGFYSAYSSAEVTEFLESNFSKAISLTISNDFIRTRIGEPYTENYGQILEFTHEEGGYLEDKYNGILDLVDSPIKGSDTECAVTIPETVNASGKDKIYMYHTHPFYCHRVRGLISGFPSSIDYVAHGSTVINYKMDGNIVLSREGVFIIQYHPYVLFLIASGRLRTEEIMNAEINFQNYLNSPALQYEEKRRGISAEIQRLSEAIKARNLNEDEIREIYDSDEFAIQNLVNDTSSFYFKPNPIMTLPFIFLQCIRRNSFVNCFEPPKFITCKAIMADKSTWSMPFSVQNKNLNINIEIKKPNNMPINIVSNNSNSSNSNSNNSNSNNSNSNNSKSNNSNLNSIVNMLSNIPVVTKQKGTKRSTKKRGGYNKMQVTPDILKNSTPMTNLEKTRLVLATRSMSGGANTNPINTTVYEMFQMPGVVRERRKGGARKTLRRKVRKSNK